MSKLVSRAGSQHMSQARTKLPVYRPSIQCFLLGTVQYYRVEPDEEALERAGASDSKRRGRGRQSAKSDRCASIWNETQKRKDLSHNLKSSKSFKMLFLFFL